MPSRADAVSALMSSTRIIDAFTRVFDALWGGHWFAVKNMRHEGILERVSIKRDRDMLLECARPSHRCHEKAIRVSALWAGKRLQAVLIAERGDDDRQLHVLAAKRALWAILLPLLHVEPFVAGTSMTSTGRRRIRCVEFRSSALHQSGCPCAPSP